MFARRQVGTGQHLAGALNSGRVLTDLIRTAAPGDDEALRGVARLMATWPGVSAVTIEVYPERAGRPPIVIHGGGGAWDHAASQMRSELLDQGRAVGLLTVVTNGRAETSRNLEAWCETAAVLLSGVAARCRLEAMLLDAQCYEVTGQIAAGLVHDFNNMLTGIMGNTSIAAALVPAEHPAAPPLRRIGEAASAAAQVARGLLNFVRGTMERGDVSVNEVALAMQQVMSRALRDGVSVDLDLAPNVPAVPGERPLIQQALVNLVLNAAEAIDGDGNVTIRSRLVHELPDAVVGHARPAPSYVALSVTDTGSGIAPEHLSQIFSPFFTTKGSAGTGLGLTSVAQVARRHGGVAGMESRPGQGATFSIYLPVVAPAGAQAPGPRASVVARRV